ncbi:protocatechuate 3,4-dioxygenase subunit alpha [Rothia kristinae]|uniref:protocatechuate 3,4-dioxygenase subunit alpha n=1 Tax=Rothia kristinae TaxID=37923 RepID=UPI0021A3E997|nr:protocatechuate 3,4-dioxygenase subunit alpha [Rothia kristinae]MCT2038205.1 protocatechuate 3,4-dioxygenase subunit alpha [Rothia kristinae]MCT2244924.1 protocatechuate 3,4-dioxygenase subunit alpha [Rothia kristinae]MCT2322323.1 protocatechuate 3,4-dioxygenase subunit alpha [Rothia kristinae]
MSTQNHTPVTVPVSRGRPVTDPPEDLTPTPGQTIGPFFGYATAYENNGLPFGGGSELVHVGVPGAMRFFGTVRDGAGQPVPDAMIEIWQADRDGSIPQRTGSLVRSGWEFTGWGRDFVDREGTFSFTTVQPGPTDPGHAPFWLVTIFARGLLNRLFTRAYLPEDEQALAADPLLASLDPQRRRTLIAHREADGSVRFDITLQGEDETVFLQYSGNDAYPAPGQLPGTGPEAAADDAGQEGADEEGVGQDRADRRGVAADG